MSVPGSSKRPAGADGGGPGVTPPGGVKRAGRAHTCPADMCWETKTNVRDTQLSIGGGGGAGAGGGGGGGKLSVNNRLHYDETVSPRRARVRRLNPVKRTDENRRNKTNNNKVEEIERQKDLRWVEWRVWGNKQFSRLTNFVTTRAANFYFPDLCTRINIYIYV